LDTPNRQYPESTLGAVVDVRDVARAHVLALTAPPLPGGRHKRLIIHRQIFRWNEVVKIIVERYPEAAGRLPAEDAAVGPQITAPRDTSLAEEALAFGGYLPLEETVLAAFEAIMDWEKRFKY